MSAQITWVCRVAHKQGEHQPLVTIHEGVWACCLAGGTADHRWEAVEPTTVEYIRPHRGLRELNASASRRAG